MPLKLVYYLTVFIYMFDAILLCCEKHFQIFWKKVMIFCETMLKYYLNKVTQVILSDHNWFSVIHDIFKYITDMNCITYMKYVTNMTL